MYRFNEGTIRTYAGKVRESWKARQVLAVSESVAARAQQSDEDIDEVITETQTRLEAISCDSGEKDATAEGCADAVLASYWI